MSSTSPRTAIAMVASVLLVADVISWALLHYQVPAYGILAHGLIGCLLGGVLVGFSPDPQESFGVFLGLGGLGMIDGFMEMMSADGSIAGWGFLVLVAGIVVGLVITGLVAFLTLSLFPPVTWEASPRRFPTGGSRHPDGRRSLRPGQQR